MEIFGRKISLKSFLLNYCFNALIIIDVFLIATDFLFEIPDGISFAIHIFDLIVCVMLLSEYIMMLSRASSKKDFMLDPYNILGLVAAIPFDLILLTTIPGGAFIRLFGLIKLSRIFILLSRLEFVKVFFKKTGLHKILIALLGIAVIFTVLFFIFGTSYGLFDYFYFVIVTLTTVGYGDVTPKTYNEKVLSIILILIGIFVFSTITAAMSSYLTDRILKDDEDIAGEVRKAIDEKSEDFMAELESIRMENRQLKEEISELKELIKDK